MIRSCKATLFLAASLRTALFAPLAAQAQITARIYSGLVGTFDTPDIKFLTSTGDNWHPFGLSAFGADFVGSLSVPTTASYTFSLLSDDGNLLFIDGGLVVDNGGPQGGTIATGAVTLTASLHPLKSSSSRTSAAA